MNTFVLCVLMMVTFWVVSFGVLKLLERYAPSSFDQTPNRLKIKHVLFLIVLGAIPFLNLMMTLVVIVVACAELYEHNDFLNREI